MIRLGKQKQVCLFMLFISIFCLHYAVFLYIEILVIWLIEYDMIRLAFTAYIN